MAHEPSPSLLDESNSAKYLNLSCMDFLLIELVSASNVAAIGNPAISAVEPENFPEKERQDEGKHWQLESVGYRVGQGLVERFSQDKPRFLETLDIIKFLCKDIWTMAFRKQVDNLKTNHRGVYVLTDNGFKYFSRMSTSSSSSAVDEAQQHLHFPCGIIRGSLASLGVEAVVHAETSELPSATFHIRTVKKT